MALASGRTLHREKGEISPDVIGYVFEKYINQKQMGAYYTKEDITDYISKNCVVPWLFRQVERSLTNRAEREAFTEFWQQLLRNSPDSYIYPAVRHGISWDWHAQKPLDAKRPLPPEIAAGVTPSSLHNPVRAVRSVDHVETIRLRRPWQKAAPPAYALPTEIWREVVTRRQRYAEIRTKIERGEVRGIADFITLNLDIRQFAQDVIERCPNAKWLRHFWQALQEVTVLDPTCGSGAFLFAALNLLQQLYEAALQRMEQFVADAGLSVPTSTPCDLPSPAEKAEKTFQRVLAETNDPAKHPTRRYFVLKEIILRNLYGVDIMVEAVEICKLRLFLALAAQVEPHVTKDNLGVELLPDVDFNVRAGNTLVGFATRKEMEDLAQRGSLWKSEVEKVLTAADDADRLFETFRASQEGGDSDGQRAVKLRLRESLDDLRIRCDRALAAIYDPGLLENPKKLGAWRESHQPFHWYVEFHGIMQRGGFSAIIGNPPYIVVGDAKVPYRILDGAFVTCESKNLYAFVSERSLTLAQAPGLVGLIVQLTAISSERMSSLQDLLARRGSVFALPFPRRPESIFDGVEMPVVILLSCPGGQSQFLTSRIGRFYTEERPVALACTCVAQESPRLHGHRIAKFSRSIDVSILGKLYSSQLRLASLFRGTARHAVFYQEACRYWLKCQVGLPFFRRNGEAIPPPHGRVAKAVSAEAAC